jgi:hypothetical protein
LIIKSWITPFISSGSGLPNSFVTGLGATFGVLFYYIFLHDRLTKYELSKSSLVLQQLPDLIGLKRIYINLIFGLIFLSFAFLLEYFLPHKKDLNKPNGISIPNGWSPTLCGVGIGFLQLFFILLFQKSLGISSGFTVLIAQLCRIKLFKQLVPSLESFTYGLQNNLTLLFSFSAILGSFIATYSANQFPLNEKYGANVANSFIGGFLLLIGARCAGGCTSGQGISGKKSILRFFYYVWIIERCYSSVDWFSYCNSSDVWWCNHFCDKLWISNKRLAVLCSMNNKLRSVFLFSCFWIFLSF